MAYLSDENQNQTPGQTEEDKKAALNQSNAAEVNPKTSAGSGGLFGNAPPTASPAGAQSSGQPVTANSSNTGFTNLSKYLDANSSQAADMGNQLASGANTQAQNATNTVNGLSNDFNSQVAKSTIPADPNAVNSGISAATGVKAGESIDPNAVSGFQKQANATYSGPTDYTAQAGYGAASQAVGDAQNAVNQTKSEAGRDLLLQKQYGNASPSGYSHGENALDQALVEGNPNAQKSLANVNSNWSGLNQILGNATNNANQSAQNAISTDAATAKAARDALSGTNSSFQGDLSSRLSAMQASNPAAFAAVQAEIKNNLYTPETLAALGLTNGQKNYGVDLGKYLSASARSTLYNIATPQQYAEAAALAQLGGPGAANYLPSSYLSQAGTGANPYSFDTTGFNTGVQTAQKELAGSQQTAVDSLNNYGAATGGFGIMQGILQSADPSKFPGGIVNKDNLGEAVNILNSADVPALKNQENTQFLSNLNSQWSGIQNTLNSTIGQPGVNTTTGRVNPGQGNPNGVMPPTPVTAIKPSGTDMPAPAATPTKPAFARAPRLAPNFAEGGEVESNMDPLKKMAYGGMMAHGGLPSVAGDKISGPPKEPRIPKLQRPDYKLPKMPGFAEGGEVGYPVDASKVVQLPEGRGDLYQTERGTTAPSNTGAKQASFDSLMKYLGASKPKAVITEIPEAKYAEGGEVIGMPEKAMLAKDGVSNMYDMVKDIPNPVSMPVRANLSEDGLSNTYTNTEEKPDPVGSPEKASLNEDGSNKYAKGGTVLDANARAHIAPKNFALPAQHKYPIHDIDHARNALSRVAQFGTPEEQATVRRQVHAHYPSIGNEKAYGGAMDNFSGIQNYLAGGEVPGRGKTPSGTNSYSNDLVRAVVSPHEIILPRDVSQAPNAPDKAKEFVKEELEKKKNK